MILPPSLASSLDYLIPLLTSLLGGGLAYAEIHYRFMGLPSRLFRRSPEILFDLPHRARIGQPVPLFLLIKDALRFPVILKHLTVTVTGKEGNTIFEQPFPAVERVSGEWHTQTILLPADLFSHTGLWKVDVALTVEGGGKQQQIRQDNYPGTAKDPFSILIAEDRLPRLDHLFWGDLHTHSNYTSSQIEFGAPISAMTQCAATLDLDFLAITDHSFDLDRLHPFSRRRDKTLKRWKQFQEECLQHRDPSNGPVIIPGEEVSVGNHKGQNVHCLVLGSPEFFPGKGDGGEIPPFNAPTLNLPTLIARARQHPQSLLAAAHPLDRPPALHTRLLRRGFWDAQDLHLEGVNFWQILNGKQDEGFHAGLRLWKAALLAVSGH